MATNSIFKNIKIKDKKAAAKFITALEKAKNRDSKEVVYSKRVSEATREEIRLMFGKQ